MLRKTRGLLPAIGFVILVWSIFGQPARQEPLLRIYGGLGWNAESALSASGFECRWDGQILTVTGKSKKECLQLLLEALTNSTASEMLILENIRHANTGRDWKGNVYRRKFLCCRDDGSVIGVREDQGDYNWVYDPSHPDAIDIGPKAGYRPMANINLQEEEFNLSQVELSKQNLKVAIQRLDPDLVLGEAGVSLRGSLDDFPQIEPPPVGFPQDAAFNKLQKMSHFSLSSIRGLNKTERADLEPMLQSNTVSSGQTCVAMCLNALTGASLTDLDIDKYYGFSLLKALKTESRGAGYDWRDAGNICSESWELIDRKVNLEGLPVIVALNGPEFSPSGRGQIVTIVKTSDSTVTYADPADGKLKTTSKRNMEEAPSHADGNFVFVAEPIEVGDLGEL